MNGGRTKHQNNNMPTPHPHNLQLPGPKFGKSFQISLKDI